MMKTLYIDSQLAYTTHDKLTLAKQVQECFEMGDREGCLKILWKCYQVAPYFLPIQPFVRHFKRELLVLEKLHKNFRD